MTDQEITFPPILNEQSLLLVAGGVFLLLVIAGISFTVVLWKDPRAVKHFRGGRILHVVTILTVAFAVVMLGLERILTGEAVASLLGGIIGYVLGSLKQSESERGDEAPSIEAETVTRIPEGNQLLLSKSDVFITHIEYDSNSGDINSEYVRLKNSGYAAEDISNWRLQDESGHKFVFPTFILKSGASIRVWTRPGANTQYDFFWGENHPVWNNTGDCAYLLDSMGQLVDTFCYHTP